MELLTTRSYAQAVKLAGKLEELNRARQLSERKIMREAMLQAQEQANMDRPILVVVGEEWNRGVLGIVASRLVERYHRPAVLIGVEDGEGKGSARSVPHISLIDALRRVSDLLRTYGGHSAAAGLALGVEEIDALKTRLPAAIAEMLRDQERVRPTLNIDGQVDFDALDKTFLRDMHRLGPFGMGNPEPLFLCGPARASRARIVGKKHLKARFYDSEDHALDGIGFSMKDAKPLLDDPVAIAFVPKINTRQGRHKLEMHIKDIRSAEDAYPDRCEPTPSPMLPTPAPLPTQTSLETRPEIGDAAS